MLKKVYLLISCVLITACQNEKSEMKLPKNNTLIQEWKGDYGGVPAFDKMELTDLEEAVEVGIKLHLQELDTIANETSEPTFKNTIEAMQSSGKVIDRVFTYYGIWSSNLSSEKFRKIQTKLSPKISEYQSKITQNTQLFERIKAVYQKSKNDELSSQKQRTLELIYQDFEMSGANLGKAGKKRYAAINKELSKLYTKFSNNVLHDEENYATLFTKEQSSGLPESYLVSAKETAIALGYPDQYAVSNTRSSMDPFLTFADNRKMRQKVWTNYYNRGDNGGEYDNNEFIKQILKLRDERVELLGYDNYAQWRLQDRMAKNPKNAMNLLMNVWPAAIAKVDQEVAAMQKIADQEDLNIKIKPWDYRYYAEKVRQQKYDINSEEVKQYLVLDQLTQALFYVANQLFGYSFKEIKDGSIPVFQEDVRVFEVNNTKSGKNIGLFYLDPYARKGKRSGAWATTYRSYTDFEGAKKVLASNNSNFVEGKEGEPILISWDDAETLFHEFGHALHFLSADVSYPKLNSGVRDYTEFQSQLLERWLYTDQVINQFLKHYDTGEPMPQSLVAKLKKSSTFNQGFATTEYLASAIMDLKYHTTDPEKINPDEFEKNTLDQLGMPDELVMRHRTPHFGHVFSGEGYATGYYGYLWADVLTSDAAEAFAKADDGFYDKDLADKMVKYLFAPRNAIDPAKAFRQFRGRNAKIEALMRDRGFPVSDKN
jgi:peptidyl-dipeptidase Dcp